MSSGHDDKASHGAAHDTAHAAHGDGHGSAPVYELPAFIATVVAGGIAVLAAVLSQTPLGRVATDAAKPEAAHHHAAAKAWPELAPGTPTAEVLLKNCKVVAPGYEPASMILVRDGKILAVGGPELEALKTPATVVKDCRGGAVMAGLRDAHGHLASLGAALDGHICDLTGSDSVEDALNRFATWVHAKRRPKPGEWLVGQGWDESLWGPLAPPSSEDLAALNSAVIDKHPEEARRLEAEIDRKAKRLPGRLPDSTELLDQVASENPVILYRIDGHCAWVNHKALELAKISHESFVVLGGEILRDERGEPSGVLVDAAIDLVTRCIPEPPVATVEEDILTAAKACAAAGLVEVQDAGVGKNAEAALRHLAETHQLPIRVYGMIRRSPPELAERLSAPPETKEIGDRLTLRAVKLQADGALGSHGAHLLAPYSDQPKSHGLPQITAAELATYASLCARRGYQLCVHAIGDKANRDVLDAYEQALAPVEAEAGAHPDHRFRVEHAQLLDPADRKRFAKLGVIASMQPVHATSDMRWAEQRVGKSRLSGAYAWHSLLESGAHLCFGSDFPVESERPLLGIYAAITRQDEAGNPSGGWLPGERVSVEQAFAAYTEGPAYASFAEHRRGRLEVGMDADLTILSDDPIAVANEAHGSHEELKKLLGIEVLGTVVGGTVVNR